MWTYQKKLQYPVKIKTPNPKMAKVVMTQLGGPDSIRYNDFFFILLLCGKTDKHRQQKRYISIRLNEQTVNRLAIYCHI